MPSQPAPTAPDERKTMKKRFRVAATLLAATLTLQVAAQTAPAGDEPDDVQPKFVWGLLLNIGFKLASSLFTDWLQTKLNVDLSPLNLARLAMNSLSAHIVPLATVVSSGVSAKDAGAAENTVAGEPNAPLRVGSDGQVNYQGVHVALVGFDADGKALGLRPLSAGFRTGERFKLHVLPTFDGLLVIDNINPRGRRSQVYPPRASDVVQVKAGVEILVPLDKDQYFEFTGAAGDEQLVLTLRDPRAFGEAASKAPAFRKDDPNGSSFLQEVKPERYPRVSQAIHLRHE